MNYPTITFERGTPAYEKNLKKIKDFVMPDEAVYAQKIAEMSTRWQAESGVILDALARITQLEWPKPYIPCYVVSGTFVSFSDPLTLKIYDNDEDMFDTFVHELTHVLLKGPHPEAHRALRRKFMEPYEGESFTVKNHIILHALHAQLALELWGEERMQRIRAHAKSPDYLRSWEIVDQYGREKILKEVFNYQPA